MGSTLASSRTTVATAVAVAAVLSLLLTPAARPDRLQPLVSLGPVTVANGVAVVSGSVGGASAGAAELTINGQPLMLDAAGRFGASVSLQGASTLDLSLRNPLTAETATIRVPLVLGIGGVIPAGTVDAVEQALAAVLEPAGGLKIVDGLPLQLRGRVLNKDELASLQVNGKDVLGLLNPDGTFVVRIPGTTREISVTTVDRSGTSGRLVSPVSEVTPTQSAPTAGAASVSAAAAVGVRIAKIRHITSGAVRTRRIRMIVTVKDRLDRLVRGATVQIRSSKPGKTIRRQQIKRSSRTGTAAFVVGLRRRALGGRLVIVTTARTPTAETRKRSSIRIPRPTRAMHRHR